MWALGVDTATMVQYWKARGGCTWSMPALCGTAASLWPRGWPWWLWPGGTRATFSSYWTSGWTSSPCAETNSTLALLSALSAPTIRICLNPWPTKGRARRKHTKKKWLDIQHIKSLFHHIRLIYLTLNYSNHLNCNSWIIILLLFFWFCSYTYIYLNDKSAS